MHLSATGADALGTTCTAASSGLGEGSDVVITSGDGTVLGSTHLGAGTYDGSRCVLPFTLSDVEDAGDYFITLDGGDPVSFNREDLVRDDWRVDVS
ncbi:hypothetical protein ACUN7V_14450 [Quadrisphaera oryzae]|uniref:hypothetical protein n=1 Tax=Quadrisphaera TaxID=317661 RepID=UPI00164656B1|nr:hypothetical protein [Quadrisphaera sp. RL12-1S]MBC3760836.1 hypothetical protein [Quadrisphaera sp. RL12-1S]